MSIPGAASPLFLATTGEAAAFEISRSLRFNQPDSSFLNRTFGSSGNRTTWTWSGWVKRSSLVGSERQVLFGGYGANSDTEWLEFGFGQNNETNDSVYLTTSATSQGSTAVFRDVSAWYHYVANYDGSNFKIYINNSLVLTKALTGNRGINGNWLHTIGKSPANTIRYFNGYLTEVNFIDGSALDPTSFGAFDDNGVWQAIDTDGLTFGTNGFRLKFADNSSNAALGTDSSGNSNTWTVNNLSTAAALNPTAQQNFDVVTYTGNGAAGSRALTGLSFKPDFVWIKGRSYSISHLLYDNVRGAGASKSLVANGTNAEGGAGANSTFGYLESFDTNGFSIFGGSDVNNGYVNKNSATYVAWCWKAGGAASSNTDGSLTSSVSANAAYGFSVVTYTGSNSVSTVGHGLGNTPGMYIVKRRTDNGYGWIVYHSAMGASNMMALQNTSGAALDFDPWNQTAPTSSVFTVNTTGSGTVNAASKDYVAYVWSEVAGFSKFGSYTGNGSTTGPVITTGFKPRFVLIKRTDSSSSWQIKDTARTGSVPPVLYPNLSNSESTDSSLAFDFLDNGFQPKTSTDGGSNANGGTYIYAAFAATSTDTAGIDSLVDTPSNAAEPTDTGAGGEVVGNYATWNPLQKGSSITLSNGNLDSTQSSDSTVLATIGVSSGKWYWETTIGSGNAPMTGLAKMESGVPGYVGGTSSSYGYYTNGQKWTGAVGYSYGSSYTTGDIIGTAFDADNGTLTFYKNGTTQGTAFTGLTSGTFTAAIGNAQMQCSVNFGQRAFAYTAPSGYKSLNTANLPTPTIADGSQYFDTKLYTGNSSTQSITGYNFSPDFAWLKKRSSTGSHSFHDVIRGATKRLTCNNTDAETTETTAMTAFNSDGFSLGSGGNINASGQTFVAWAWDGGTSTVTNNDGSIASQVRAQPSAGFSIIKAPISSSGGTIGTGLNASPGMLIVKNIGTSGTNWVVWHSSLGTNDYLLLNSTAAKATSSNLFNGVSNSTFTVGSGFASSTPDFICYAFAPVAGYSAMGSYVGNANSDGPFVALSFRPAFIFIKNASLAGSNWIIIDTSRDTYNEADHLLKPNKSDQEQVTTANEVDLLSNGFKLRGTDGDTNGSGNTMIYYAVAENPFQANGGLAR